MKISFVDTDPPEREFFEAEFSGHDLQFCCVNEDVPKDAEVLSLFIDSKIGAQFLDDHPALKLIATRSTTHEHIDIAACAQRKVSVCSVGSYGDHTVSEHTFALILAICRCLRQAMETNPGTFSYATLRSMELYGKTLGVVGAGRIGRQTLRLAKAFSMIPIAYDTNIDPKAAEDVGFQYVPFEELLQRSDFISINIPLTDTTFHLFNEETFRKCRQGVILINTARGGIVDTLALIEALDSGIVGGAGLDVLEDERVMRRQASRILREQIVDHVRENFAPSEPLLKDSERINEVRGLLHNSRLLSHPNVVFTPHIAFNSMEAIERITRSTAENIKGFMSGSPRNLIATPPLAAD